jgi:hypothetical protein
MLIGCGGLLAMVTIAGIVVAAYWPRISSLYHSATSTMGELRTVQSALRAKYETRQVGVTVRRQPGVAGNILSIQLVNPPFLSRTQDSDLPAKAREVAIEAREALPATSSYDHYQVLLTRQRGVVFTLATANAYWFEAKDLPPRAGKDRSGNLIGKPAAATM